MLSGPRRPASETEGLSAKATLISQAELAGLLQGRKSLQEALSDYTNAEEVFTLKPALRELFKATETLSTFIWFRLGFQNAGVEPGPLSACIDERALATGNRLQTGYRMGLVI